MAFAGRRELEWRCRQWSQGSKVETVHVWMKSFAKDNCPSQHQEYFSVSLSPLLVFSSPAKTAVPFSCPLPATCQGAASVFGTLQPGRAEQPQGLQSLGVQAVEMWVRGCLGKGAGLLQTLLDTGRKRVSRNAGGGPPLIVSLQSLPTDQP